MEGEVSGARPERARVLVVEDTPDIRELLSEILSAEGYEVSVAEDGEKALAILQASTFQLVLLDLMMPGMTGMEVLARLRAQGEKAPPVVAMSAFERFRHEATSLGARTFLYKPIDVDRLLREISEVITTGQPAQPSGPPSVASRVEPTLRKLEEWLGIATATFVQPRGGDISMVVLGDASLSENLPGGLFVRVAVRQGETVIATLQLSDPSRHELLGAELALAQYVADCLAGAIPSDGDPSRDHWGERLTELLADVCREKARRAGLAHVVVIVLHPAGDGVTPPWVDDLRRAASDAALAGWCRTGELVLLAKPRAKSADQLVDHVRRMAPIWSANPAQAGAAGIAQARPGDPTTAARMLAAALSTAEHVKQTAGWGIERAATESPAALHN